MRHLLSFLLLSLLVFPAKAIREVEFEWEEVEDAKHYQVELRNEKGFTKSLTSSTPNFKIKNILPGKYQIRGQVHTKGRLEKLSSWSEWKAFDVPPTPSQFTPLKSTEFKIAPGSFLSKIPLQWSPSEGVSEYILEIFDASGQSVKRIVTQKPQTLLELRPGSYTCTLTTKTADGLESEVTPLNEKIFIQNIPVEAPKNVVLDLKAESLSFSLLEGLIAEVSLERQAFLSTRWEKIDQKTLKTPDYRWSQKLRPGKYRITLISKNTFNEISKPFFQEFIIKPQEIDLQEASLPPLPSSSK